MGRVNSFSYKIRLLMNLGILVWVSALNTLSRRVHRGLLGLLFYIGPSVRMEGSLLASTYEHMRERLRESLEEIEQKSRQLEESKEQLKQSRDMLQNTIDSIDEELLVLDSQFRITKTNRSFDIKHHSRGIVGRHCYEVTHGLSHPCDSPWCPCPVKEVWQTGMPTRVVHIHRTNQTSSGKSTYVEISVTPLYDSRDKITQVVELTRDITERKKQENRIIEANQYLLALNAISATVSQTLDLDVILRDTLDKVLELMKANVGGILLLDEKSQTLSYRISRGLSENFIKAVNGLALGEGIAGKAVKLRETLVVENISKDPRVTRPVVREEGLKAFVSVPLLAKEKVVGVLNVAGQEVRPFSQEEVQLLTAIGQQLGIAVENAQLYHELQLKEEMRTELLRQIISAQEDERRRVARELHDVTSQALATLAVRVEALSTVTGYGIEDMKTKVDEIKSLLGATSQDVHRLIYDLRPSLLDDLGLSAALRSCARSSLATTGIELNVEVAGCERRLPQHVEIAIFRIVQEALANIVRHSRSESTYINLDFKERSIAVQVEDDGVGFDMTQVFSSAYAREGLGLVGMRERAELIGGMLTIDTKPGIGTKVAVEIPINEG